MKIVLIDILLWILFLFISLGLSWYWLGRQILWIPILTGKICWIFYAIILLLRLVFMTNVSNLWRLIFLSIRRIPRKFLWLIWIMIKIMSFLLGSLKNLHSKRKSCLIWLYPVRNKNSLHLLLIRVIDKIPRLIRVIFRVISLIILRSTVPILMGLFNHLRWEHQQLWRNLSKNRISSWVPILNKLKNIKSQHFHFILTPKRRVSFQKYSMKVLRFSLEHSAIQVKATINRMG